jgi:putative transposase
MEHGKRTGRRVRGVARAQRRRKKREEAKRARTELRGRRFTPEQREHALVLLESGGMTRTKIASVVGTTTESLRRWLREAETHGTLPAVPKAEPRAATTTTDSASRAAASSQPSRSPYIPRDLGQGLSAMEVAAILDYKQKHPSMGPAQIRVQLKRFKGWRTSIKAIARVLRKHGYEPVHRGSRAQGPEPQRFEAPRRNALWQMDFTELRVDGERCHLLVVEDDFSRYVVGHELADSASAAVVMRVLEAAIARHGLPEAIRTDRGGAFTAGELTDFLESRLIDHIVGHSYHPQGGGKVESVIGTVKRELWEVEHFHSRAAATARLAEFFGHYNECRAHMGIDGLTPADRFFARADRVLSTIDAVSRKRQAVLERLHDARSGFEETLAAGTGAPMEVLRLVIVDGQMELRFCGARVGLGPLVPAAGLVTPSHRSR